MDLKLVRFSSSEDDTLGILYVNGIFECFILEDEYREEKVMDETRIPEGTYEIRFRTSGGMFSRYSDKWLWHGGMLELQDVPNFKYIYFHPGNKESHTSGCLLTGDVCYTNQVRNGFVGRSTIAYERLYKKVALALATETVKIEIKELCGETF